MVPGRHDVVVTSENDRQSGAARLSYKDLGSHVSIHKDHLCQEVTSGIVVFKGLGGIYGGL